jgi:hypothetical protein
MSSGANAPKHMQDIYSIAENQKTNKLKTYIQTINVV